MKFSVHVMSPPPKRRPPDVRASSTPLPSSSSPSAMPSAHPHCELKILAVPIDPQCTFADLWKEVEKRFRQAFDKDKLAGMYFSHLQDSEGGYITASDTVGSMYKEDAPAAERQLYMYVDDVDREDTIPIGSELRPREFRKRRWTDMDAAEQATVKRRRHEEERYGAPLDELDPDTPIVSREAGNGRVDAAGTGAPSQQNDPVRMDADGFKIPARPNQGTRQHPARAAHQSPIVLVNSSQPDDDDGSSEPPTPESTDRRSGGDTPPSAQRPAPTQQDESNAAASPETPPTNAFDVLGKSKSGRRSGAFTHWSAKEDKIILKGIEKGWTPARMLAEMPGSLRSGSAVRNRRISLLTSSKAGRSRAKSGLQNSGQALEVTSSPPVASGSTAPLSSPCETARRAKSPAGPTAYVQLTQSIRKSKKSSPDPPPTEPVVEQVHCQTATPPTSNASEASDGRLRAPSSGPSNASRLRRARTNVKPLSLGARLHEADPAPASVVTTDEKIGVEEDSSRADPVRDTLERVTSDPKRPDSSVVPDVVENRRDFSNTADDQVNTPPKDHVSTVQAVPDTSLPAQPTPEVTLPKRKENSIYHNRTDKQRWKEALGRAKGDKVRAREIFIVNLHKEDMLDAVSAGDEPEIERLKAQRRRRERELAISKGLPIPKRRVPSSLSSACSSRPDLHDADEEVIREDDWTTDEGEGHVLVEEDDSEEEDDEGAMYNSDEDEDLFDVEARLDGPRIAELEASPPPPAEHVDAVTVANSHSIVKEPLDQNTINSSEDRSLADRAPPEVSSRASARKKKKGRPSETRRRRHLGPSSGLEPTDIAGQLSTLSPEAARPPLRKAAVPSAATTSLPTPGKARKQRKDASASLKREPATPSKPSLQPMATPSSRHSQPGKKKLVVTPKAKLTREAALAAHLAECKRKEALYLNNDDDDDDDDSSDGSSS